MVQHMKRRIAAAAFAAGLVLVSGSAIAQRSGSTAPPVNSQVVQVYKSPTCGCCANWVKHLEQAGFKTQVHEMADVSSVKTEYKVPARAQSCHTAVVGGYVLEGHVPAADVRRLLRERPAVLGLAVPGMPIGSPGMEVPNRPADKYDVVSFDKQGQMKVFASH
jgi:hypothetical protein